MSRARLMLRLVRRHPPGCAPAQPPWPKPSTGTITGRAVDSSAGVLPGVEVSITSPSMIGGARTAFTDEQGVYRFTQLASGEYRVSFKLSGFKTLNIEGVRVDVGATMTINGKLEIDSLSEEVTVISDTPVIDLQSTSVGVNWDEKQMEDLPYGRGIRGLARLVPGLSPTQFDVGGNTVGGSTTTGARCYGRSGQELIKFDGVVWDQFFGDYNTYEQVQVSAAAKGAEAQSPGVTLSFVIKSGGNKFSGMYLARLAGRRVPGQQRDRRSCAPRATTRATTSSRATTTSASISAVRSSATSCGSTAPTATTTRACSFPASSRRRPANRSSTSRVSTTRRSRSRIR